MIVNPDSAYSTEETSPGVFTQVPVGGGPTISGSQAYTGGMGTPTGIGNPLQFNAYRYSDPYSMVGVGKSTLSPAAQAQLSGLGISEIPTWMQHYGSANYDQTDIAANIQKAMGLDPNAWLGTDGKMKQAMHNAGVYDFNGGKAYDLFGNEVPWGDATKGAIQQAYLNRSLRENKGGFNPLGQEGLGLASVLAPIAIAIGGYGMPEGAAVAGGEVAGGTAGGVGAAGGAGVPATAADLSAIGGGIYGGGDAVGAAIAAGGAAGADVGMGAGTSWMTDLGWPASYGFTPTEIANLVGGELGGVDGALNLVNSALSGQQIPKADFVTAMGGGVSSPPVYRGLPTPTYTPRGTSLVGTTEPGGEDIYKRRMAMEELGRMFSGTVKPEQLW